MYNQLPVRLLSITLPFDRFGYKQGVDVTTRHKRLTGTINIPPLFSLPILRYLASFWAALLPPVGRKWRRNRINLCISQEVGNFLADFLEHGAVRLGRQEKMA